MWVSPIRLRWTILTLGFVIVAASVSLVGYVLISLGEISIGPSRPPFWDATPFLTVLLIIGATAALVINIRARGRGKDQGAPTSRPKTR
jgi:hypothetical protein